MVNIPGLLLVTQKAFNFIHIYFMKKPVLFLTCVFITGFSFCQKVVFVIADGIPADVLESTNTPKIQRVINKGTYVRAHVGGDKDSYNQTPTMSAVGYNSLITGTWANKHNVWGNDIKAPNYYYPNIFKLFKEQYPDKKIAVYSSWIDNRIKLVGDSLAQTNYLKVDYKADGFELDTIQFPHDKELKYMHLIDEKVINEAEKGIKNNAPDLSWVYLEYTDDMGHRYGDSPQLTDAIQKLDTQVGKLYDAVLYRQKKFHEQWLLIITTDHGRDEKTGRNHGGQTNRQRSTWIAANTKMNEYAKVYYPGIVDIMPTLANYLQLKIPQDIDREIDGISLIGKTSVAEAGVNLFQNKLDITWRSVDTTGTVKIWLSITNDFKAGGKDQYFLLKEIPVNKNRAVIDITQYPSTFYKIVIEGKYNSINKWISKTN
jgi:predicted AlkP superfamily pyrophosphatase or phosphodiesterase